MTEVICQSHLFHYTYIAFPLSERISSSLTSYRRGLHFGKSVHVFIALNMYTTMKLVITSVIFFRLVLLHVIQFSWGAGFIFFEVSVSSLWLIIHIHILPFQKGLAPLIKVNASVMLFRMVLLHIIFYLFLKMFFLGGLCQRWLASLSLTFYRTGLHCTEVVHMIVTLYVHTTMMKGYPPRWYSLDLFGCMVQLRSWFSCFSRCQSHLFDCLCQKWLASVVTRFTELVYVFITLNVYTTMMKVTGDIL